MPITIEQIKALIDTDLLAAFTAMDRLEWGNRRGDYFALKEQWIDPPVGTSASDLRNRLKLILGYAQLPPGLKEIQQQAKEKIVRSIEESIKYLDGKLREGDAKTSLQLLQASAAGLRKNIMLNLIDFNQQTIATNQLRVQLMSFIDGLSEEDLL